MPTELLLMIGAGGHAKVVYDAIERLGKDLVIHVRDDDAKLNGNLLFDSLITAPIRPLDDLPRVAHIAIGDNRRRSEWCRELQESGRSLQTVVHPDATVSDHAQIGDGSFLGARCVVGPHVLLGTACIVNHGAVVDHDCVVGAWAHIAPNATLGGRVRIGAGTLIGAGAVVLPEVSIGQWAIVGAGAVVTREVAKGETVAGVPARNSAVNEEHR